MDKLIGLAEPFATEKRGPDPLHKTWTELTDAKAALSADIKTFAVEVAARAADWELRQQRRAGQYVAARVREGLQGWRIAAET